MSSQGSPKKRGTTFKEALEGLIGEPIPDIPPIETAVHEAGHAITAAHLGLLPILVEIHPETEHGEMTLNTSRHPPTLRQRLLVAQAGSAAQCRLNGEPAEWTVQGVNDRVLSDELAEDDPEIDPNDFAEIEELLGRAVVWARVMRLAEALAARHRIEIPELTVLLTD